MSGQWVFDARQVMPSEGIETWPAGWHPVIITASEEKPVRDGEGFYWQYTIKAIDGPMKDKTQFIRVNHKNKNPQAVEIAMRTQSSIMHVTGVLMMQAPAQLHNIPFLVEATVKSNKRDDGSVMEQNEFRNFKNGAGQTASEIARGLMGGAPAQAPAPAFAPAQAPAPAFAPAPAAPAWGAPAPAFAPAPAAPAPAAPPWGAQAPAGQPPAPSAPPWGAPPQG
jgi:hypothetical protein